MNTAILDTPVTNNQIISFAVRMERPDRKRAIIRRYFDNRIPTVYSTRQLAGFLTHKLFSDRERGGAGTLYHITIRYGSGDIDGFTVRRSPQGEYLHV